MSETFGAALKRHRLDMEISRGELASIARRDATYVGLLERDARTPSRQTVLTLAEALEMTTSQTDRLLYAAGYAPRVDYQQLWETKYGPTEDRKKWCPRCQESLLIVQFSRDRARTDGLHPICKACESIRQAAYRTRAALGGRKAS